MKHEKCINTYLLSVNINEKIFVTIDYSGLVSSITIDEDEIK
ncbi:MAG: hypothetical protein AB8U39_04830 [Rickettsia conorii subsp. raoultii]|nr:hypothetical protein [Rickettsia conorii]